MLYFDGINIFKRGDFMASKNRKIIFGIIFALISVAIGGYSFILYQSIEKSLVSEVGARAQGTANTVALLLENDIDNYKMLTDNSKPYDTTYYNKMLSLFSDLKARSGSDFLYTVNYVSANKISYVLDGESPGSKNFSALGITDNMSESNRMAFKAGSTNISNIIDDRAWGSYLSASTPIFDKDRKVIGLVCVDYSLKYIQSTITKCLITLIIVSVLSALAFSLIIFKLVYERFNAKSVDYLTGLYSRSYLDMILPKLIKKSITDHKPLSLIMIDIDYFKGINDTYGHAFGDKVLKAVAEAIDKCTRSQDICIRQGGDEFMVLLPELGKEDTIMISKRILKKTSEVQIDGIDINAFKITLSIGASEWKKPMNASVLIKSADEMLYLSKNSGKNMCSA